MRLAGRSVLRRLRELFGLVGRYVSRRLREQVTHLMARIVSRNNLISCCCLTPVDLCVDLRAMCVKGIEKKKGDTADRQKCVSRNLRREVTGLMG